MEVKQNSFRIVIGVGLRKSGREELERRSGDNLEEFVKRNKEVARKMEEERESRTDFFV